MKDYNQREPQISERELERQYLKIAIKKADAKRFNCYRCPNSHIIKTIDIHHGVTPMFLRCEICGAQSVSTWYNDIIPDAKPTHEWRVPNLSEIKKYKRNPYMLDHIFRGGLELFKIK